MEAEKIENLNLLLQSYLPNIFGFNMLSSNNDMIKENDLPFTQTEINVLLNDDFNPVKKRLQLLNDNGFFRFTSELGDELMKIQEWNSASLLIQSDTFRETIKEILLLLSMSYLRLNDTSKGKMCFLLVEEIIVKDTFTSIEIHDKYRRLQKEYQSLN